MPRGIWWASEMQLLVSFAIGLLFGGGLLLSGMANPQNVLGFLDVTGAWNPALAFVMAGAIGVAAPVFAWVRRHPRTLGGAPVVLPARGKVTSRLVLGSALFGVGWGLAGLCPGPALVLLGQGGAPLAYAALFVAAMAAGLALAGTGARSTPD
jgi:uncharacterized protein